MDIAKIYIRSIVGTLTLGAVVMYLQVTDTEVLLGLFGAVLGLAMIENKNNGAS